MFRAWGFHKKGCHRWLVSDRRQLKFTDDIFLPFFVRLVHVFYLFEDWHLARRNIKFFFMHPFSSLMLMAFSVCSFSYVFKRAFGQILVDWGIIIVLVVIAWLDLVSQAFVWFCINTWLVVSLLRRGRADRCMPHQDWPSRSYKTLSFLVLSWNWMFLPFKCSTLFIIQLRSVAWLLSLL